MRDKYKNINFFRRTPNPNKISELDSDRVADSECLEDILQILPQDYITVYIDKTAFEKAQYIADTVSRLGDTALEIGFYLIRKNDTQELIIDDIYIWNDQIVTSSHCKESNKKNTMSGGTRSLNEITRILDSQIIGWGHSHSIYKNFFSEEDKSTNENYSAKYGIKHSWKKENKTKKIAYEKIEKEGKSIVVSNGNKRIIIDAKCISEIPDFSGNALCTFEEWDSSSFFYGMTFNMNHDKPYSHITLLYDNTFHHMQIDYKIVENNKCVFDKKEVDKEIIQKVDCIREKYDKLLNTYKSKEDEIYEILVQHVDDTLEIMENGFSKSLSPENYKERMQDLKKTLEPMREVLEYIGTGDSMLDLMIHYWDLSLQVLSDKKYIKR